MTTSSQHFRALARKSLRVPHAARWLPGVQRGLLAQAPSLPGPGVVRCNRCGPCGRAGCSFQRCFQLGPVGQPQGLQPLWVPSSLLPEAGAIPSVSAGAIPRHEALLASLPSWGSPGSWLREPKLCCSVPVGSWSRVGLSHQHLTTGPRRHYGSCVLVWIFQPFADVFSSERQHCAELGEEQKSHSPSLC